MVAQGPIVESNIAAQGAQSVKDISGTNCCAL
jgi:hypothetical protein